MLPDLSPLVFVRISMFSVAMMHTTLWTHLFTLLFWFSLIVVLSCISYLAVIIIYYLRYHPYARYPGPFWARISPLHALLHAYRGDLHLDVTRCHERYGMPLTHTFFL